MASLRGGFAGAELDTAGALALATAGGAPPDAAAAWIADFTAGMHAGIAGKRAHEAELQPDGRQHRGRDEAPE